MKIIFVWVILFLAKILSITSRLTGRGSGTALPGLLVEERAKWVIGEIGKNYEEVIFISGTNGKTTTRALLVDIYEKNGVAVCTNRGGANIFRGLAASLMGNTGWNLRPKSKVAILEVEEATLPILTEQIKPNKLILTNVFRDQLDAYGEIDKTVDFFRQTLSKANPQVIINADDSKLLTCLKNYSGEVIGFTVDTVDRPKYESDQALDLNFKGIYVAKNIYTKLSGQEFEINTTKDDGVLLKLKTNLPGVYNVYNVLAAAIVGYERFGEGAVGPIEEFRPVFGRGEQVQLHQASLHLFLIKNPAGFDQVLDHLSRVYGDRSVNLILLINDKIADSKDVSWLWDVDLEKFIRSQKLNLVKTSGTRGLDMLLRLEYAGAEVDSEDNFPEISSLVEYLSRQSQEFVILSTYTATLALREELGKYVKLADISEKGN